MIQEILEEIKEEVKPLFNEGSVADYIPALARVEPNEFAMSVYDIDGNVYSVGSSDKRFSIQSISKVFTFVQIIRLYGKNLLLRLGLEPSGNPFNSLVQLEYENGIPRNPFINAGAIVLADMLLSKYKDKTFEAILNFIREVSDNQNITYNDEVYKSEKLSGYRNYALVSLMKSFDNIKNHSGDVMSTYFKHCSIEMSVNELSRAMLFLANHGVDPISKKRFLSVSEAKRVNAVMLTCGHYDASGDFAFRVGLPGKSGVGGGIVAVIPEKMAISVYSPKLNANGNSLVGTKALELFTTKSGLSIF